MNGSRLLIKFGGSLCDPQVLSPLVKVIRTLAAAARVVIIPGGGPFSKAVRALDREQNLGATTSHWMAIAAMDQYGRYLEREGFGISTDDPTLLEANGSPTIFLPYQFLRANDSLPHSWSVTSDSIAAHLASVLRIDRLVLLKAVDAPASPCPVGKAIDAGVVDPAFNTYLAGSTECWMLNGKYPKGLLEIEKSGVRLIREAAL